MYIEPIAPLNFHNLLGVFTLLFLCRIHINSQASCFPLFISSLFVSKLFGGWLCLQIHLKGIKVLLTFPSQKSVFPEMSKYCFKADSALFLHLPYTCMQDNHRTAL